LDLEIQSVKGEFWTNDAKLGLFAHLWKRSASARRRGSRSAVLSFFGEVWAFVGYPHSPIRKRLLGGCFYAS
jgi:hypothetical protein